MSEKIDSKEFEEYVNVRDFFIRPIKLEHCIKHGKHIYYTVIFENNTFDGLCDYQNYLMYLRYKKIMKLKSGKNFRRLGE